MRESMAGEELCRWLLLTQAARLHAQGSCSEKVYVKGEQKGWVAVRAKSNRSLFYSVESC